MKSWFLVALVALLAIGLACGSEETAPPVLESPVMEPTKSPATTTAVLTPAPEPTGTPEPDATNTPAPAAATSEPTATPTVAPAIAPSVVQDLTVRRVTEDSLTLEWEPPANSDVAPVDEYEVIRDVSLLPDQQQLVWETTFTDTGLTAGTEHSYRIRAIGVDGAKGDEVGIVVFTLDSPTPTPVSTPTQQPTATPEIQTPTSVPTSTPSPTITAIPTPPPVPTPTPTPETDVWLVVEDRDTITDVVTVGFISIAVEHNLANSYDSPYLAVGCSSDVGMYIFTHWGGKHLSASASGQGGLFNGSVRFDSEDALTLAWVDIGDNTTAHIRYVEPFLNLLLQHDSVYVRIENYDYENQDARFILTGLSEHLQEHAEVCGEETAPTPVPTPVPDPTWTPTPLPSPTAGPASAGTWRGLTIAPENRCAPYDSDDYSYSPSVEPRIVADMGGIIYGPYSGSYFASIRETDIEHIVARSEAHDSGLCMADAGTRKTFASDLLNLTLASPSVNRHQKVDNDAAEWLPDLNRCWYANRVIRVRGKYNLTIDQREADALDVVLAGCTSFEMVVVSASSQAAQLPTSTPTPRSGSSVDALALYDDNGNGRISCAEARAHGIAPVRSDHPAYPYMNDADGDGVVCE